MAGLSSVGVVDTCSTLFFCVLSSVSASGGPSVGGAVEEVACVGFTVDVDGEGATAGGGLAVMVVLFAGRECWWLGTSR